MQPVKKIQQLLDAHDARPMGRFGQCFLIDLNYMAKVLDIAAVDAKQCTLEVGPGTGSLTEELLKKSAKVVAAEIDRKFCEILREIFGERENFTLIEGDALDGKHAIAEKILHAVSPRCSLVANLPYNAATSLVIDALIESCLAVSQPANHVTFDSLTFTVQKEVADRLAAVHGDDYGLVSVIVALMSDIKLGPVIPPSAFWP
ncbi:MAG TPA: rRNA adenine dimethyltransferase family protein, partial [Phycisphaerae bacterium]|nr:rRNA adenine dimethyltransferase family protein [Phycisphaerae bacterium]